jgi:hypothetical protein
MYILRKFNETLCSSKFINNGGKKNVKKNYKNLNSFYNKLLFSINKIKKNN